MMKFRLLFIDITDTDEAACNSYFKVDTDAASPRVAVQRTTRNMNTNTSIDQSLQYPNERQTCTDGRHAYRYAEFMPPYCFRT